MSTGISTRNEPVAIASAVTAALVATVNTLAFVLEWSGELVALLNGAIGLWVVVISLVVRSKVTPVATLIEAHEAREADNYWTPFAEEGNPHG